MNSLADKVATMAPAPSTSGRGPWLAQLGRVAPALIALAVLLVFWEVVVRLSGVDPTLWTPPSRVWAAIPRVTSEPLFRTAVLQTLQLLSVGFAISATVGIGAGLLLGRYQLLDRAFTPWVVALYATPLPSIIPIITAAIGYALGAKLVIVVMISVFVIMLNAMQGVTEIDPQMLEVTRAFGTSETRTWFELVIPSALPFILVGLRLGIARALIGTVVAEFFTSPGGLGYQIIIYSYRFDIASTMVPVLTLTILGLLLVGSVALLEWKLTPWQDRA